MNKIYWTIIVLLMVSTRPIQAQPPEGMVDPAEAMKALGALMGGGSTNAAIHFRQLKELLPAEFNGMKRSNTEAGKNAAFGMNIAYAQAEYARDGARISVKISDISSMAGFMRMAQFAWAQAEMEKESDDGFERTGKMDGFPTQENYRHTDKSGGIQVMVGDRFTIETSGTGVEFEELRNLLKAIDPNRLNTLKPEDAN